MGLNWCWNGVDEHVERRYTNDDERTNTNPKEQRSCTVTCTNKQTCTRAVHKLCTIGQRCTNECTSEQRCENLQKI